jgi:hypothetical protein
MKTIPVNMAIDSDIGRKIWAYKQKGKRLVASKDRGVIVSVCDKRHCSCEGCKGTTLVARWPNGKLSYPCSAGLSYRKNGDLQIL